MPLLAFQEPPQGEKSFPNASPALLKVATETRVLRDVKDTITLIQDLDPSPPNAYPVVKLDVDTISEATASRLAASLLGHVLFLKNQIPFPVVQLGRLPGGKTNNRAAKLRMELMASYDTISSHLDTTFSALATALARCDGPDSNSSRMQTHVAILVGPSLGSAKAKVIMGIDGMEKKIWGLRNPTAQPESTKENSDEEVETVEEEEDDSEVEDDDDGVVHGDDVDSVEENDELPEDSDEEEDEDEENDELSGEDEEEDVEDEDEDEDEASVEEEVDEIDEPDQAPPPPYISYAEEQKFLQNADRLLSRILAAADAEGNGIASEMAPTQTHILIRAPRLFKHPAWVPRQNVTSSLDGTLEDFLAASGVQSASASEPPRPAKAGKKGKVEGVWVAARGGIDRNPVAVAETRGDAQTEKHDQAAAKKDGEFSKGLPVVSDEDAEMIWWSWDGKFVGFSDW